MNTKVMQYTCKVIETKEEMMAMTSLLRQLNTSLTDEYIDECLDDMIAHGYRMAVVHDGDQCVGLSGIWVTTKFYSGKYLEMDNVVVDEAFRSKGIGSVLSEFVTELARREGCVTLMLDAWLTNEKAHEFYERQGFVKRGFHFLKSL
ncbi:MAG: GNAT family N-acetyltransferase [Saprospiraceae bacterium]|jgi:GNAT superfamily N-acetyltransferase|nr:GNAT family N-acetyltransferase [Saprospiraceae bacterium]